MEFLKAMKVRLKELQSGTPPKGKWSTVGSVERKALAAALKAGLLTVGKEVGSGGQGHVFIATHSGKQYALKQSSFAEGSRQERIAQADLEFGTSLQHDCLQEYLAWTIQEAGVHPSKGKKLLMLKTVQLLAETDLHDALDKGAFHSPDGLPKLSKLLTVFHEVARGVAYLHTQRVVHCDLKHSNVLLTGCDTSTPAARVCDFGLCVRIQSTEQEWCLGRHGRGTHGYIAPEIYPGVVMKDGRCMSLIALRSDVYSMGIMLWEALTLCAAASHSKSVSKDTPRVPTTVHPNFPRLACFPPLEQFLVSQHGSQILHSLEKLISGMCHADWQQRPNADSVVDSLSDLVSQVEKHGLVSASRGHLSSSSTYSLTSGLNPKKGMLGGKHKHKAGGNHKLKPDGKTDGKRGKDSGTDGRKSSQKSSKKNKGAAVTPPANTNTVASPPAPKPASSNPSASPGIHAVHAQNPAHTTMQQTQYTSAHVPSKNAPTRTLDVDCVARISHPQPNETADAMRASRTSPLAAYMESQKGKELTASCLSRAMCTKTEPSMYSPPALTNGSGATGALLGRLAPAADPTWLVANEPTCSAAAKQVAASNSASAGGLDRRYGTSTAPGLDSKFGNSTALGIDGKFGANSTLGVDGKSGTSSSTTNQDNRYNSHNNTVAAAVNKMPLMKAVQEQLDEAMSSLATFRRSQTPQTAGNRPQNNAAASSSSPTPANCNGAADPSPLTVSQAQASLHSRSSDRGRNLLTGGSSYTLTEAQPSKLSPSPGSVNPLHSTPNPSLPSTTNPLHSVPNLASASDVNDSSAPGSTRPQVTSNPSTSADQQQSKARPGGILARWHQMMEERGILNPSPTPAPSRMDLPMSQLFSINMADPASSLANSALPPRQDPTLPSNPVSGNHPDAHSPYTSHKDRNTAASTSTAPDGTPQKTILSSSILDAFNSIGKPPMHPPVNPAALRTGESVSTVAAAHMDVMRSSQESLGAMNAVCRRLAEREDGAYGGTADTAVDPSVRSSANGMWSRGPSALSIRKSSSTFELQPGPGASYSNRMLSSAGSQLLSLDRSLIHEQVRWDSPSPTPLARGMSTCSSMFDLDGVVGYNFDNQPLHTAPVLDSHISEGQFTLRSSVLHSLREARSEPNMLSPRSAKAAANYAFSPTATGVMGAPLALSTRDTNLVDTMDLPYPPLPDLDSLSSCATMHSDFEIACGSISDIRPALFYHFPSNVASQGTVAAAAALATPTAAAAGFPDPRLLATPTPGSHAVSQSGGASDSACILGSGNASDSAYLSGSVTASETKLSVGESKLSRVDSKLSLDGSMLSIDTATIPGSLMASDYRSLMDKNAAATNTYEQNRTDYTNIRSNHTGTYEPAYSPAAAAGGGGAGMGSVRSPSPACADSSSSITSPLPKVGSPFLHSSNLSDGVLVCCGPQGGNGAQPAAAALPSLPSLSG